MQVSQVILTVDRTLKDILRALNHKLTFADNFQCVTVDIADSGVADTEFTVRHNLGVIPQGYIANSAAGLVNDSDKSNWSATEIKIKCSASNASIRLVIF